MHRLFIDQNVRIEIAQALRADGHEAVHASESKRHSSSRHRRCRRFPSPRNLLRTVAVQGKIEIAPGGALACSGLLPQGVQGRKVEPGTSRA
jgi:hypothetical protein